MKRPHLFISTLLIFLFSTCDDDADAIEEPQVLTNEVTRITSTGAVFNGELQTGTKEPVEHHGFIWNTDPDVSIDAAEKIDLGSVTKSGSFSTEVSTALEPNARYYVRAYVISKQGNVDHLIYGNEVTFISLGSEAPVISEISPLSGNIGDTISIRGKNFSSLISKNIVRFGDSPTEVIQAGSGELKVKVPAILDTSSAEISVSVYGNISEFSNNFKLNAPIIRQLSPEEGYSGNYLTVYGNNFITNHTHLFLGEKKIPIQSTSADMITAYLPYDIKSGENTVKVKVFDQETTATSTFFNLSPEIISVTPLEVTFGDTITVTGTGFLDDGWNEYAYVSDTYATIISTSKNEIKVVIPGDLYSPENYLRVTVNGFTAQYSQPLKLKPPVITGISPEKGPGGTQVTINGKYFSDYYWRNSVYFNDYSASIVSASRTQIVAMIPDGLTGTLDLKVTVANQTTILPGAFEIQPPEILDFNPKKGTKGTVVTIAGANLSSSAAVYIGSAYCEVISATDTELQVRITSDIFENSGSVSLTIGGTTVYGPEAFRFVWTRKSSPWYYGRIYSIGFTYQDKGYLGLGYDYTNQYDISEYNAADNYWYYRTSIADANAGVSSYPASFLIDGNLYVYAREGYLFNAKMLKYDIVNNSWDTVSNIPESRTSSLTFSANGMGYLGLGLHENAVFTKNFFEYDPATDTWNDIGDFPGEPRIDAIAMDIDGEIFAGLGQGETSTLKDLYKFNASNKSWTRLNDFPASPRSGCATFTVNGMAYIIGGKDEAGNYLSEVWAYDPGNDSWERKSDFAGNRFLAGAFALNAKGYVGGGYDDNGYYYTGDMWEYDPLSDN